MPKTFKSGSVLTFESFAFLMQGQNLRRCRNC